MIAFKASVLEIFICPNFNKNVRFWFNFSVLLFLKLYVDYKFNNAECKII